MAAKLRGLLVSNAVTVLFVALCGLSIFFSGQSLTFIFAETIARVGRNAVLILSLILPVLCGMGLNFSIVVGAMAGEIALILITHWNIGGWLGFLVAGGLAVAFGCLFGFATGRLLNKTVGQEMITGIILGYFSIGLFDLTFLILLGRVIPFNNPELMLESGGLKNTIAFHDNVKQYLDNLLQLPLGQAVILAACVGAAVLLLRAGRAAVKQQASFGQAVLSRKKNLIAAIALAVSAVLMNTVPTLREAATHSSTTIPVATGIIIALLCLLTTFITKTKLGQDIRTTGQNMDVAIVAGINVRRCRMISIMFSTSMAAIGQIIFLQNMGNVNTFSSHEQVGQYAIAALLVGGASIKKAGIGHVFLGAVLFHILFFTSPLAGMRLFGDAQIGEYFRVFIGYAVITISLVLYAVKRNAERRREQEGSAAAA